MTIAFVLAACGGSTARTGQSIVSDAGSGGRAIDGGTGGGGSGSGGTSGGSGSGGTSGGSGSGGIGPGGAGETDAGTGGADAGAAGCAGLDYCDCSARKDCAVLSEACFCPCGERCQPSCACVCGGGAFLGCTASSIAAPGQLDGIWLVGWSGGLNHYSWVRFDPDGKAVFLDGAAIGTNAPYWRCSGKGSWLFSQKPETVFLTLPAGCSVGTDVLTFTGFKPPLAGFPKGAILGASLESNAPTSAAVEAWKFPPSQCDAALATCKDPFGFPP